MDTRTEDEMDDDRFAAGGIGAEEEQMAGEEQEHQSGEERTRTMIDLFATVHNLS